MSSRTRTRGDSGSTGGGSTQMDASRDVPVTHSDKDSKKFSGNTEQPSTSSSTSLTTGGDRNRSSMEENPVGFHNPRSWLSPFDFNNNWPMSNYFDRSLQPMRQFDESLKMNMDWTEHGDKFQLAVDMPGVPKENVKLDVQGRVLTVTADKQEEKKDDRTGWYSKSTGRTTRSLTLPPNCDPEHINANIVHGQLRIMIPKKTTSDTRTIRIE